MKKQLLLLLIFLAFTTLIAAPKDRVAAEGAKLIHFTATSTSLCPDDPRCSFGKWEMQASGKTLVTGFTDVMLFTASDPRWNAVCVFHADPFRINDPYATPIMGSFTCKPTDEAYSDGGWEGHLQQVAQPDKRWIAVWSAKGYGTLDGLTTTVYNTVSSKYDSLPPDTNNVGVITELPKYQP